MSRPRPISPHELRKLWTDEHEASYIKVATDLNEYLRSNYRSPGVPILVSYSQLGDDRVSRKVIQEYRQAGWYIDEKSDQDGRHLCFRDDPRPG